MKLFVRIIITSFALLLVAEVIPGIEVAGIWPAIFASILLGVLNALVRPVLIFFTLPITILTLGLFIFIINGFIFWLVASFVPGVSVSGFWVAFFSSIIVSIVSSIANKYIE